MNVKDLWIDLFDSSLEKYRTEDSNIRNVAMILHVFQLEFRKVCKYVNKLQLNNDIQSKTIQNYEHELKNCSCKINNRSPLKSINENANISLLPKIKHTNLTSEQDKNNEIPINLSTEQNKSNEDIFNDAISEADVNVSKENDDSLFVDNSFSNFPLITSPTLNNRKSRSLRTVTKNSKLNNSSIIQGTPTLKVNKVKKLKQTKLPPSFSTNRSNNNSNDTGVTFCFPPRNLKNEINKSGVEVDDILEEINITLPANKKVKMDNSYDYPTPVQGSTPKFVYKREAVRKKVERLQLQGWGCADCEKYYAGLDLPEEALKDRMNKCSKHRDNFKPMRLTPEGFWNPDFTPTQNSFAFEL